MKKILFSVLMALSAYSVFCSPMSADKNLPAGPKPKDRPSVALVLAGGGAKGFAHLPVIEYIEELGIPIDMVIGTSIGSIIGGLYCAGYSPSEICESFDDIEWGPIFSDTSKSPYESLLEEHSSYQNLVSVNLGLNLSLQLGKGLSNGQNIYQLIKEKLIKYPSNQDFNNLPVPFRAVTCNMLTGEGVVLDDGDIAEAIRASMSLPSIFEPMEIDGTHYMDGGIRYNLPINVAKKMGYDIIIAVDISQKVRNNLDSFSSNPIVAMLNTITISQYTTTESMYKDASVVVFPDISTYGTLDFKKSHEIYEEGKKILYQYKEPFEEILKQIYPNGKPESKKTERNIYRKKEFLTVDEIVISGEVQRDGIYIKRRFEGIKDKQITPETFSDFMDAIKSTGNYKAAKFRIINNEDKNILELQLTQTNLKSADILFNFDFASTYSSRTTSMFNTSLEFQYRGLTGIGSVMAIRGTAINNLGLEFFYHQPFSGYLFMQLDSEIMSRNYPQRPLKANGDFDYSEFSSFRNSTNTLTAGVRTDFGNILKAGLVHRYAKTKDHMNYEFFLRKIRESYSSMTEVDFISEMTKSLSCHTAGAFLNYEIDTQDRYAFARKGIYFENRVEYLVPYDDEKKYDSIITFKNDTNISVPLNKVLSFNLSGTFCHEFTGNMKNNAGAVLVNGVTYFDRVYFPQLAGPCNFGTTKVAGAFSIQVEPWNQLTILGGNAIIRLTGTAGNVVSDLTKLIPDNAEEKEYNPFLWSGSAGIGVLVKKSYSIFIRVGAASTYVDDLTPFFAVDIGSLIF